jgi:hypothetical protein
MKRPRTSADGGARERTARSELRAIIALGLAALVAILLTARPSAAQSGSSDPGIDSGNYNIHTSIDFGYRYNDVTGNQNTFNTFINLQTGVRLFDSTLEMRSLNHQGTFFDDLYSFNFGWGGDPNDVSRLHIDKNKWYDFNFLYRRDKNFWDYNLLANPLNPAALNPVGSATTGCIVSPPSTANPGLPAYCSNPSIAQTTSPHSLNLARYMQDYNVTLLPQSPVRFRFGYSRVNNQGPGFFTTDSGTEPMFPERFSYVMNAYNFGVDLHVLPRTTITYNQFLNSFGQNDSVLATPTATPQLFNYQVPNGTPVYLGMIWTTQTPASTSPCAAPISNAATIPPTANPICNGFVSYSQSNPGTDFMPTERLQFQSNYFQKFQTTGSFGYSTANPSYPNFNETMVGWITRSSTPGETTAGPAKAKRDTVDADWSGVYSLTDKLRVEDFFHYYNWRIPGLWDSVLGNLFTTGGTGLGSPIGTFVPALCDVANNYSGPTCPSHTTSSAADVVDGFNQNFLKQDMKSNTFELAYDRSRRISGYIGWLYTNRSIVTSSLSYNTANIYYPGGVGATAANFYLAARGSCALVGGALPANCVLNANGSITATLAPPTTGPTVSPYSIGENALVLGVTLIPMDSLRITGDFEFGYNNAAFTRIDPRNVQSYKVHVTYTPKPWASLAGAVEINDNRDNVFQVANIEHDNSYSFTTMLVPNPRISVSFGYNYWNVYTQTDICFNYSITYSNPVPPPTTLPVSTSPPGVATIPCPIAGASVGSAGLGTLSTYTSKDNYVHADVIWKPAKRVAAAIGYGASFVRGSTIFLNPLTPSGMLDFNYQMPYASVTIDLYKGFSYKTAWNYYGFNQQGNTNPFGLGAIPSQDFNGNTFTFSFRYAF